LKGVFADLVVGEAVFGLEPHPEGGDRGVGQQDGTVGQIGDARQGRVGVGDQDLRVLLEEGGDGLHRRALGDQIQGDEAV